MLNYRAEFCERLSGALGLSLLLMIKNAAPPRSAAAKPTSKVFFI